MGPSIKEPEAQVEPMEIRCGLPTGKSIPGMLLLDIRITGNIDQHRCPFRPEGGNFLQHNYNLHDIRHPPKGLTVTLASWVCSGMAAMAIASTALSAQTVLPVRKILTLEAAHQLTAAVRTQAQKNHWKMVTAVVDAGGNLVLLERMDDAQTGSIDVATQKARTAISFKRPTKTFEERTLAGRSVLLGLPGVIPIEGGLPIIADGQYIGAIGVSGGSSEQDGIAAQAAVDALKIQ